MAINQHFAIQDISLSGGVAYAVTPPRPAKAVNVFSLSTADASLYAEQGNEATVLTIAPGWNQPIELRLGTFTETAVAFWLKCSLDCSMVLLWV